MSITIASRLRRSAAERRSLLLGLLFVSPWLLGFLAWAVYPLGSSLYYSFTRYDLMRQPVFLGPDNYVDILTADPRTPTVVYNTLYYVGISAPLGVASAFLLAILLNTRIVARSAFRALFFLPSIVPAVVTAAVWRFLLSIQYGAVNAVLRDMGLRAIPFLSSPLLAKPSLILVHVWGQGAAMVIFLASLQDVPRSLYEAATVDGANAWHRFWHVTVPLCTPVILFNLIMAFIGGFQQFVFPWLLTEGGPGLSTELYALHLYRNAFQYLRMGKASALAWLLLVTVVLFTIAIFRSSARWVYYGGEAE